MTVRNVVKFFAKLPGRAIKQFDNSVFDELCTEHGAYIFIPILFFLYVLFFHEVSVHDGIGSQRDTFYEMNWFQWKALFIFIFLLNGRDLVDRRGSRYVIRRSSDPDRFDSILREVEERKESTTTTTASSTKMYFFLWETFYLIRPGHLSLQLFDINKTFVSYWPGGSGMDFSLTGLLTSFKRALPNVGSNSINEDIIGERGHKPDVIIIIPEGEIRSENINEMVKWYKSEKSIYKTKFKNCSDIVKQCLKAGNFKLANPSLRFIKLGLSVPNDIADRIIYTLHLRLSNWWIQHLHSILTVLVWMILMNIYVSIICFLGNWIPTKVLMFLLQSVWLIVFPLFRAVD